MCYRAVDSLLRLACCNFLINAGYFDYRFEDTFDTAVTMLVEVPATAFR